MKKAIVVLWIIITAILPVSSFAGSIPEDLLCEDYAQVFFAEVLSLNDKRVELSPVKKIKGDIKTGTKLYYENPSIVGDFKVIPGNVYLFTYFDENNPTYIFDVTGYDTKTLKIKHTQGDMWKRFEQYLNEERYEKAELERTDRANASLTQEGEEVSLISVLGADKSTCDKIGFSIFNTADEYEIDKDKFFKVAENIMLTKITNKMTSTDNSFVIYAISGNETYSLHMWDNCLVGSKNTQVFSAPVGDYVIKAQDHKKLTALLPESAQSNLPPIKSTYANIVYWAIYNSRLFYAISGIIIIALIGGIGFIVGYKLRKKRKRG